MLRSITHPPFSCFSSKPLHSVLISRCPLPATPKGVLVKQYSTPRARQHLPPPALLQKSVAFTGCGLTFLTLKPYTGTIVALCAGYVVFRYIKNYLSWPRCQYPYIVQSVSNDLDDVIDHLRRRREERLRAQGIDPNTQSDPFYSQRAEFTLGSIESLVTTIFRQVEPLISLVSSELQFIKPVQAESIYCLRQWLRTTSGQPEWLKEWERDERRPETSPWNVCPPDTVVSTFAQGGFTEYFCTGRVYVCSLSVEPWTHSLYAL
jgi:hypothetical protein